MSAHRRDPAVTALWVERVREAGSITEAARQHGANRLTVQATITAARRAAGRGEVGNVPPAATPPEGFIVTRNGAEYDAAGVLQRQWVGTQRDSGEPYETPAGHVVKGESALLDADGRLLARWVKTREGAGEGLVAALQAAFTGHVGQAAPVAPPDLAEDDTLTVYPLPDLHLGMYAWGRETGEDYDTDIAVDVALSGVRRLVDQSRPSRRAVILGLGDYFHANDEKAATPGSGHRLDVDGRWARVFGAGARLATALVDIVARKHAEVEVVFLPGNHDPDAAICLTVALALFYSRTPQITVCQEPGIAWYRRFGKVLLGGTHGHTMKADRMAMMMATDRAADWGQTEHRVIFFGHIHHETAREVGPVRVESFSSPAGRDAYNAGAGYRAGRALSAITYHREEGEIGRHRVSIRPSVSAAPGVSILATFPQKE